MPKHALCHKFRGECYDCDVLRDRSQHPPVSEAGGAYTRKEVCRLLKLENRQLRTWERQQLIPELSQYTFSDLLTLKRLVRLRNEHAHPRQVRQALHSLRDYLKQAPHANDDVQVYKDGRRVRLQIGKQKLEAGSGQLLFDFAEEELNKILQLPALPKSSAAIAERLRNKLEADRWFERGLELEQTGAPYEQIIEAYQKASELDPQSAGARVNLGTVFFNGHAWADAEEQYQAALAIDPDYALSHFNLGNLYDERGDSAEALHHYSEAIRIHPNYADAHYNLALLHQSAGDVMSALKHWRAYLKLDAASTWAPDCPARAREIGEHDCRSGQQTGRFRAAACEEREVLNACGECLPVGAVILAAGAATRMGRTKQLLIYRGKSLIEHAVAEAQSAGFDPIVVVVGAEVSAIRDTLAAQRVTIAHNENWLSGMGSSVAAGMHSLCELDTDMPAVALLLADQPLVAASHLEAMRMLFSEENCAIVASRYNGTLGVPAIFKRSLFPALASLSGDTGARTLLRNPEHVVVAFDLPEAAVDVDTPEDFDALNQTA